MFVQITIPSAHAFLDSFNQKEDEFVSHIVTGDETLISYGNADMKKQIERERECKTV